MAQPIFVDLENNGGHIRIDPPTSSTSYMKLMVALPRQFADDGQTHEAAQVLDFYISKKAAGAFRDALSLSIDEKIQQLIGM